MAIKGRVEHAEHDVDKIIRTNRHTRVLITFHTYAALLPCLKSAALMFISPSH